MTTLDDLINAKIAEHQQIRAQREQEHQEEVAREQERARQHFATAFPTLFPLLGGDLVLAVDDGEEIAFRWKFTFDGQQYAIVRNGSEFLLRGNKQNWYVTQESADSDLVDALASIREDTLAPLAVTSSPDDAPPTPITRLRQDVADAILDLGDGDVGTAANTLVRVHAALQQMESEAQG